MMQNKLNRHIIEKRTKFFKKNSKIIKGRCKLYVSPPNTFKGKYIIADFEKYFSGFELL